MKYAKPRNMLIITLIALPLFFTENIEAYLAHSIVDFSVSALGLALYVGIFVGYLVLQQFAINFIRKNTRLIKSRSKLIDGLQKAVILAQYALAINIALILIQIFVFAQYSVIFLFIPTLLGLGLVFILFITFGIQFLRWRRNLRQSLGILLFACSFLILGAVQTIDIPFLYLSMLGLDPNIKPDSEIDPPVGIDDPFLVSLIDNGVYTDYAAFTLMIFGTALLLWQYSRNLSKPILAMLIALPLVGYAGSDLAAFHIDQADFFIHEDEFFVFLSVTSFMGWMAHSFAFLYVAHKLPESSIKTFLNMVAIGFIFYSISYTVDVRQGSYPPYAANSFALFPISVFMILFGIYGSGLALSQDVILRKRIKALTRSNANLLSSIGTAQVQNEVARVVGSLKQIIDKEETELREHSGITSPMGKEEIEEYLQQVLKEVKGSAKSYS